MKKILVTGAAGFIGFSICNKLLENGINVHGLDNLNEYYDPRLKKARLEILTKKVCTATEEELDENRSARSAKLRALEVYF